MGQIKMSAMRKSGFLDAMRQHQRQDEKQGKQALDLQQHAAGVYEPMSYARRTTYIKRGR